MFDLSQAVWHKASRSNNQGGNCVEIGWAPEARAVRDSKLGEHSPILAFDTHTWTTFLTAIKTGRLDR